jgi:6,7-dimethyl-8-ribityllumazine synthase
VICLGAVIRGGTPHFECIARAVSEGIMNVALTEGRPIVFGVLTTETVEQAEERADPAGLNRGAEAARTAIEMALLAKQFAQRE